MARRERQGVVRHSAELRRRVLELTWGLNALLHRFDELGADRLPGVPVTERVVLGPGRCVPTGSSPLRPALPSLSSAGARLRTAVSRKRNHARWNCARVRGCVPPYGMLREPGW